MTRALLLVSLLCGGCLIVPAKKSTSKAAGHEYGARKFVAARSIELTARANENAVLVHAIRQGECMREVRAVTETTTEKKAKLGGANDPRAAIFGLLLAPVTIPASALVTGLILASDTPVKTTTTRPLGTQRFACSEEAEHLAVQATLASGAVLYGVTDSRGDARIEIPATEPYSGSVTVAAQGAEPQQVAYSLPRPALVVAREAVQECGARGGVSGPVEVKLRISAKGFATRLWLSAGNADVNTCIAQRVSGVRFPEKTWERTIKMPVTVAAPAAASL